MYSPLLRFLLACVLANLFSNTASATIVERTSQLDLTTLSLPTSDLLSEIAVTPFTVDVGDTLIFHLQFVGGRLNIKDSVANSNDYFGLQFLSNPGGQTGFAFGGHWYFEDVVGDSLANNLLYYYGGPIGGSTSNINLTDSSFSMSGITYTVDVNYKENGRPHFTADAVQFHAYTGGRPSDAISAQVVPLPSTISLASLALVCLVFTRRLIGFRLFRVKSNLHIFEPC